MKVEEQQVHVLLSSLNNDNEPRANISEAARLFFCRLNAPQEVVRLPAGYSVLCGKIEKSAEEDLRSTCQPAGSEEIEKFSN